MTLSSFMSTALLLLAVAAWKQAAAGIVGMLSKVRDRTGGSWKPDGIVDVGANTGEWTREVRGLFPDAKILMVEATPMHEDTLRRVAEDVGNAEYRIAVCTARDGEKVGYYQGKNTGNSLFRENTKHYENDAPVQRTSATVDSLVRSSLLGDGPVDVIKADVQGAELLVLQGATRALGQASFVYLEASTIEYNQGAPCFYEVDAFLRSRGYYLYDIADLNYNVAFKTFGLGQYDVLYIRPDSPRLPQALKNLGGKFCGHGRTPSRHERLYGYRAASGNDDDGGGLSFHGFVFGAAMVVSLLAWLAVKIFGRLGGGASKTLWRKPNRGA